MKRYFLAEKLKYRHTFLPFLVVAMPLMTCLLAAFLTGNYFAVDSFNWWYMMMFPGMTAIANGILLAGAVADPVLLMDVPEVRGISDVFASPCSVYGACGQPVA